MAFRKANAKVLALVAGASDEVRDLFNKQEKFTITESRDLKPWLQAALEGRLDLAERLLDHGLRLEHFQSVLNGENEFRVDALAIEAALNEEFQKHVDEFDGRNQWLEQEKIEKDRPEREGLPFVPPPQDN